MATFRSLESIILSMLDRSKIVQPNLDIKPGTLARDITIDAPAQELAKVYVELRNIANLQSTAAASGLDLDNLGRNYGLVRGTGSRATGVVVFTTNSLDSDILIPSNSLVTASNGFTFRTQTSATFEVASASVYRSNAIRLRTDLDLAGLTDEYALEVAVEATNPGAGGNVGRFGITTQNLPGVSGVTNLQAFSGGSSTEEDDAFRSRILAVFAGSNTGTALGYINALLVNPRIADVLTVEPGDPLMTRDGTIVDVNDSGERIVITSGTGGKVDIYIQGSNLESFTESFIYRDQSGKNDPTSSSNDFVLGQRGISTLLDFQQRRQLTLKQGTLPYQPVGSITSVSGSLSGPNFIEKYVDDEGITRGSYELLADDGVYGGSVFGFDKMHFISGTIKLTDEATTKGPFNGQDAVGFTDVDTISQIRQNIVVNNEAPTVNSTDRSLLTLDHTPVSSVERVVNVTTGERYTISDQNPDGTAGGLNTTGRIRISGNTLPTSTDVLQANYIWDIRYDDNIDYDDLTETSEFRTVQDSIDWGFANRIIAEQQTVVYSSTDGYHILTEHSASKVVNVNTRVQENAVNNSGKLTMSQKIVNIFSITDSAGREVYYTAANNGSFSNKEITLPTDTVLANTAVGTVIYNLTDLFSPDGYDVGSFSGNIVRLPDGTASVGQTVYVDYVANVNTLLSATALSSLPATGSYNQFVVNSTTVGNQPITNIYDNEDNITSNLRFAPSYLAMNISGIPSRGRLTINGTSFRKIEALVTVLQDSLTLDLETTIKSELGLSAIPTTGFVPYVAKVERVTLSGSNVSSVDYTFDLLNYSLNNTDYSNGKALESSSLGKTSFTMSATEDNTDNIPTTGQTLRIEFYYSDTNQTENLLITSAGTHYSEFKYLFVKSISVASGFTGLSGNIAGNITITSFTQPIAGNTYYTTYDYVAPKEGERITVQYNLNRLIADATLRLENVRPITADVLVKAATAIEVDVSMLVVASTSFAGTGTNLVESVKETLTVFLTGNGLASDLDASDVINACYSVSGVDRVTLTKFNTSGNTGIVRTVPAERNEYITAGTIDVEIEER